MDYIYDKLLIVNGIKSVEFRSNNVIKLFINGDNTDYYRQIFQNRIVIKYLYLEYEPKISLIFHDCFVNMVSVGNNEHGIYLSFSFKQTTPERSLKLRKIINKQRR